MSSAYNYKASAVQLPSYSSADRLPSARNGAGPGKPTNDGAGSAIDRRQAPAGPRRREFEEKQLTDSAAVEISSQQKQQKKKSQEQKRIAAEVKMTIDDLELL
ncbi:hypothetical protein BOX15_Mlig005583g1 [Macrostomum lignano]|uniref:Uncharacterized protein n=1 Tax=Macrostomum lignano TaxID=282301 RepID=A0A267EGG0_9PLAT|nr:hypothetical protein BOX15_Mlig005583g1 [Macrostomum lignano]